MFYALIAALSFWAGTLYADWRQQQRTARYIHELHGRAAARANTRMNLTPIQDEAQISEGERYDLR